MGRAFRLFVLVASIALRTSMAQESKDRFVEDLRNDRVQLEIPSQESAKPSPSSSHGDSGGGSSIGGGESGSDWLPQREEPVERESFTLPSFSLDLDLSTLLLFLLGGVVVTLVALIIVSAVHRVWIRRDDPRDEVVARTTENPVEIALVVPSEDEVDRLAAAGRYSEAIHLILLRSIDVAIRTTSAIVRPAATGRELVSQLPIPDDSRSALRRLVRAVEWCHFGGAEATREQYEACRADHRAIAEPKSS